MKKRLLNILLVLNCLSVFAQTPAIQWQNTIGGSNNDILLDSDKTTDGGYVLVGYSYSSASGDKTENNIGGIDYWVVKVDSIGNIQWQNTIGGNSTDLSRSIEQTSDGGYIIGGESASPISGDKSENEFTQGLFDIWIVKLNTNGVVEWDNTIGGTDNDFLEVLKETTDGGFIIGGTSWSVISGDKIEDTIGMKDWWIIKLDVLGNIQWQNTIGGTKDENIYDVNETDNGGFILIGTSNSAISGDKTEGNIGLWDYWIVKLDSSGAIEWDRTIGGNEDDFGQKILQTSNGGYVVGGYSKSSNSIHKTEDNIGGNDYWIVKLDSNGSIEWNNTIGGTGDDALTDVVIANDGGFLLGGFSQSSSSFDKSENSFGLSDYWIVKIDSNGIVKWNKTIGGVGEDNLYSIHITNDKGIFLAGQSDSDSSGYKTDDSQGLKDYWIVKLDSARQNEIATETISNFDLQSCGDSLTATIPFTTNGTFNVGNIFSAELSDETGSFSNPLVIGTLSGNSSDTIYATITPDSLKRGTGYRIRVVSSNPSVIGTDNGSDLAINICDDGDACTEDYCYNGICTWIMKDCNDNNACTNDTCINGQCIYTQIATGVVADFSYTTTKFCDSLKIDFANNSSIGTDYLWDFGDGSNSILENPSVVYDSFSTYDVSLTVTETVCGTSDTAYATIEFLPTTTSPNSDFSYTSIQDCEEMYVSLTNTSTGGLGYWWDFGNGLTSNDVEPVFIYQDTGVYTITLVALDSGFCAKNDTFQTQILFENNCIISGNVFKDFNQNCIKEAGENGFENAIIKVAPGITGHDAYFVSTDSNGNYTILISDTGNYTVELASALTYWQASCPVNPAFYTVNVNGQGPHNVNFGNYIDTACSKLEVDISSGLIRRNQKTTFAVDYCNNGSGVANNVVVEVDFPDDKIGSNYFFQIVNSSMPGTLLNGRVYSYNIGTLNPGDCGRILISVFFPVTTLDRTYCTKASIYPKVNCSPVDSNWDYSDIKVEGDCSGDTTVNIVVENLGLDMLGRSEYRVYEDELLIDRDSFQIAAGDSIVKQYNKRANKEIHIEADQRPGHPNNSFPNDHIEGCDSVYTSTAGGFVNHFILDDVADDVETDCKGVSISWDPNDKQVIPIGISEKHYIDESTLLEYTIRFQNTGNDTAFWVQILDTLDDALLDISSIRSGVSSHENNFRVFGAGIVEWTFDNILLPDSNVNEEESHGFVKFKINLKKGISKGSVIENKAAIYFDFNAPVITNTVFNTIYDTILITSTSIEKDDGISNIVVFPNPFAENTIIAFDLISSSYVKIKVTDILGKVIMETPMQKENAGFHEVILTPTNDNDGLLLLELYVNEDKIVKRIIRMR